MKTFLLSFSIFLPTADLAHAQAKLPDYAPTSTTKDEQELLVLSGRKRV